MRRPGATLAMAKHLKLIHPFLFAATIILFVYSRGQGQIPPGDLIRPLILVAAFVLVLSVIATWVTGSSLKGTLVASACVISLVVTEAVASQLTSLTRGESISFMVTVSLLAGLVGFLIGLTVFLRKTSQAMTAVNGFVSISAFALFTFNVASLAFSWPKSPGMLPFKPGLHIRSLPTHRPDIFYLVLDAYARDDVLRDVYAHDNSSFVDFLQTNGFYLAKRSRANYIPTFQSLASALNMDYLDPLLDSFKKNSNDREPLRWLISHNH